MHDPLGKLARQTKSATDFVRWQLVGSSRPSVYFYTLHKCASSLFAGYILPNALGLRHVHFARQIHRHFKNINLDLQDHGHIYGPIRVSANRNSPVYKNFVRHVIEPEFLQHRQAVFLIRDPRDILVSAYYSFGFNHKLSPNRRLREQQLVNRSRVQEIDIDTYALQNVKSYRRNFQLITALRQRAQKSIVLKFETMVSDFDRFASELTEMVRLRPSVLNHARNVSRPKTDERENHRRKGSFGEFRRKLRQETIDELNHCLANVLCEYDYPVQEPSPLANS